MIHSRYGNIGLSFQDLRARNGEINLCLTLVFIFILRPHQRRLTLSDLVAERRDTSCNQTVQNVVLLVRYVHHKFRRRLIIFL